MNWASFSFDPSALLLETSALLMSSHSLGFPALHLLICPFHVSLSLGPAFHLFANFPLSSRVIPAHPWRLPGPPSLVTCSVLEMQPFTSFSEVAVFPPIVPVTRITIICMPASHYSLNFRRTATISCPVWLSLCTAQHSCSLHVC